MIDDLKAQELGPRCLIHKSITSDITSILLPLQSRLALHRPARPNVPPSLRRSLLDARSPIVRLSVRPRPSPNPCLRHPDNLYESPDPSSPIHCYEPFSQMVYPKVVSLASSCCTKLRNSLLSQHSVPKRAITIELLQTRVSRHRNQLRQCLLVSSLRNLLLVRCH
jgi:hypothetical protein